MTVLQVKLSDAQRHKVDMAARLTGQLPADFIRLLLDTVEVKVERTRSPVRLHKRVVVQYARAR